MLNCLLLNRLIVDLSFPSGMEFCLIVTSGGKNNLPITNIISRRSQQKPHTSIPRRGIL